MFGNTKLRQPVILAACLLAGLVSGMASLWLSIVPSFINHRLVDVAVFGASYNQRLGFVVFLGVSIQGSVLAWLLTILTGRSLRHVLYGMYYLVLGVLFPGPAALYPILTGYDMWIRFAYGLTISVVTVVLVFRTFKRREPL